MRRPRLARVLALAIAIAACAASISCGELSFTHEVRVTVNDPAGRLGAAPWKIAALGTTNVYDGGVDYAMRAGGGEAGPGAPYVGHFTTSETRFVTDTATPRVLHFALVIPALNDAGWFRTQVVVLADGTCRGYARFAPWGELAPPIAGELLLMKGAARPNQRGWDLDLTIDVPRRAEVSAPASGR